MTPPNSYEKSIVEGNSEVEVKAGPPEPSAGVEISGLATGNEAVALRQLKTAFDQNGNGSFSIQTTTISYPEYTEFPLSGVSLRSYRTGYQITVRYIDLETGLLILSLQSNLRGVSNLLDLKESRTYGEMVPCGIGYISRSANSSTYRYGSLDSIDLSFDNIYSMSWFIPRQN